MFAAIADVLSQIVQPCYALTGNWWAAIALFTLATKVILFPLSLWVQWNSIVMVRLMPQLNRLKVKYFGDREAIGEEQSRLYKKMHYHPLLSLVPLAVQIVILFGLVDVIHAITDAGAPGTEFLGLVPIEDGGVSWVMPLGAGLSAVALGFAQNRINPLQREQSRAEKNLTNGLSIGLSLVLGVFVAAGMAFYWICSNVLSIAVQVLANQCIKPAKHIDYADLAESRQALAQLDALEEDRKRFWFRRDPLAARERADYKRFFNVMGKHIVFFSEGGAFYRYFQGAIEYLFDHSDVIVHYVTNDPDDGVFALAQDQPRLQAYFIGPKRSITLMMKMDADVMAATLEDFDNYHIKRSYVRDDIEYVFFFHHMTSVTLTPTPHAFDGYDTVLCAGPHQVAELREQESRAGLAPKRLVEVGYDLLDREIAAFKGKEGAEAKGRERTRILVAPSWQADNLLDSCFDELMEGLLGRGWTVTVRPHPEYVKRYRPRWEAILARYAQVPEDELRFECDLSSSQSIWTSDLLITDWSSIACEFSFATGRPTLFVDTPMKVGNPDWRAFSLEPTDISLRNQIGRSFAPHEAAKIGQEAEKMLQSGAEWAQRIFAVRDGFIFNLGCGGDQAGEYLLQAILRHQSRRAQDAPEGARKRHGDASDGASS